MRSADATQSEIFSYRKAQTTFTLAAYNLTRMATIFGWRLNTV